jgi:hypothetical protein
VWAPPGDWREHVFAQVIVKVFTQHNEPQSHPA